MDLLQESLALRIYFGVVAFIFGAVFGSFINCLAWRVVHKESVLHGRSHCAVCGHVLGPADLVPIFSFLFLGGRCRYCGEKISPRYFLTELLLGTVYVVCFLRWGFCMDAIRWMAMCTVLLGLSLVDLESYEIPDGFIVAAIVIWAATFPLCHTWAGAGAVPSWSNVRVSLIHSAIGAVVISGGMLAISLVFDRISGKESLGGGDIKLFFTAGLYLGTANGLLCVILSCVIGLIFAAAGKKKRIPFGPSISLSVFLCALFGARIVNWYMGLLV